MATILKTKNSVTAASAPSSLAQGELAVNITDKKMWVGNAATTPVQLFGAGADGSFTNLAYTGTLTGGTGVVNLGSGQFYKDASGNFGLNTTSPNDTLEVAGANAFIRVNRTAAEPGITFRYSNSSTNRGDIAVTSAGAMYFTAGGSTERMRITSAGYVLAGTTATPSVFTGSKFVANGFFTGLRDGGTIFGSETTGGTAHGALSIGQAYAAGSANDVTLVLQNNAGQRIYVQNRTAGVYLADGGVAWIANSDERLKENLLPITDAVNKVSTLRAVTGNYIEDADKKSKSFLIAQDVQAVLPEAVDVSDPEKLGVAYTDVIPLLVAAIKELKSEIDLLKGN